MLCAIFDLIAVALQQVIQLGNAAFGIFPGLLSTLLNPLIQTISGFGCQL